MRRSPSDMTVIRTVALPLSLALIALASLDMVSVTGNSMEPTIEAGERVLVFRGAYGFRVRDRHGYLLRWREPDRGDIVLFENPLDGSPVVKRCVGIPGDRLIFGEESIYVNGRAFPLDKNSFRSLGQYRSIPPNRFFLVGDNPAGSVDSRHYGPVSLDSLLGRVVR